MNPFKKTSKSLITSVIIASALAFTAISTVSAHDDHHHNAALEKAVAGEHRSAKNKVRDQYRHPIETLSFFGFEPSMTVVEITPGGGWYTEI